MSTRSVIAGMDATGSVVVEHDGLDTTTWSRVALTLAGSLPRAGGVVTVSADRLIGQAGALLGLLARAGVGFRPDQAVTELLQDAHADRVGLNALLRRAAAPPRPVGTGPLDVVRSLREFQVADLDRLWAMRHGANFSVPGAGKTTVTFALHARERNAGRVQKMLVVGPLSAFTSWEEEALAVLSPALTVRRWDVDAGRADVTLINYQRLAGEGERLGAWMRQHRVHLVIDEAHRAKRGALGEWGRSLLALAPLAARRDVLTGTPAPNHPKDLASLLDILWPGGTASRCLPQAALAAEPGPAAMGAVNRAITPLFVRTTKEDLRLPSVTFKSHRVRLGPLQQDIYDAMLSRYSGMFDLGTRDAAMFAQMGEVTMYLIQAASSPQLLAVDADPTRSYRYPSLAIPAGSHLAGLIASYADHEVPAKIEATCRIVHANATAAVPRKTLIWSNFPDNLLALERQLAALRPAVVYGGIPSGAEAPEGMRTRERELARFKDPDSGCMVLLANPAAMSEGVSLHTVCHEAVYVDRTFNAGQYLQSLDRIHRLGLPDDTVTRVHLLVAEGTIDERIRRRVEVKMRRLSQMLADPALVRLALPDDEENGAVIDDSLDLAEVLHHLAEDGHKGH